MASEATEHEAGMAARMGAALDTAIDVVSPGWAAKRRTARARGALVRRAMNLGKYRGAKRRRGNEDWLPGSGSADADLLSDLPALRDRSRDLIRNHPIANGAVESILANEIRHGIRPRAKVDADLAGLTRPAAREVERAINRHFRLWNPFADVADRVSFFGIQDLTRRSMIANGDALIVGRDKIRTQTPYLFALQSIETDRLSTPTRFERDQSAANADIIGGVEVDADGADVAYWVEKTHPGETRAIRQARRSRRDGGGWTRIPKYDADGRRRAWHLYKMKRAGQTRGEPFFAPVMEHLHHLDDYLDAELMAARVAACIGLLIKTESPEVLAPAMADVDGSTEGDNDDPIESLYPGLVQYLGIGESAEAFNPSRPGESFDRFVERSFEQIGAGMGLPYQVLVNNFKGMNFSQMRGALVQAGYVFGGNQAWLIEHGLASMWGRFVGELFEREFVSVRNFGTVPDAYTGATWIRPGREPIDPLKEEQANAIGIANDTLTVTDIVERRGDTIEEHVSKRATERELLEAEGLDPDASGDTSDPATLTRDTEPAADNAGQSNGRGNGVDMALRLSGLNRGQGSDN